MSDEAHELRELVRSARAWVEWVRDSGVVDLPSEGNVSRELAALGQGGLGAARAPTRPVAPQVQPAASASARAPTAPEPIAAPLEPAAPIDLDERRRQLDVLAGEAAGCTGCRLHEGRTRSVFARGAPEAEIVFVGEGPGVQEDQAGLPFVGPAGQLLDKMIVAMGLGPREFYIMNAVKCRPPDNRKPAPDELEACAPFLQRQLELMRPKVIVALGATAVQALIGSSAGITRIRGTWKLYRGRVPIMPTFHPAYLLRSPDKKREVWDDLKQVLARVGREPPAQKRSR